MSAAAFIPITNHPAVTLIALACLAGATFMVLSALGKYLGWLSIKNHPITDPELRESIQGIKPPAYLSRLLFWLAAWMAAASAYRTFFL